MFVETLAIRCSCGMRGMLYCSISRWTKQTKTRNIWVVATTIAIHATTLINAWGKKKKNNLKICWEEELITEIITNIIKERDEN